ncbi:MAG: gliding motility-associated C-terminal domain-containing protein [Flavobacteriales bacterium]|nr:gliding motility-associated C-terminal domain-containing protein [Flavobacteriales bacterium]
MKLNISKYVWPFILILVITSISLPALAQNTLVLNGGITVLNGGTAGTPVYLVVNEANTSGITRLAGGGHIHSENQYNFVRWVSGASTGSYVFPFGVGGNAADYIPFTFNKTAGNSDIDMSTWQTDQQNNLHPAATNVGPVTSMTGVTDSVLYAIDRFWDIQATATADLTFSYLGIENTTASPTDTVMAQHWNGAAWDPQVGIGNPGVTAGVGTAGPYLAQNTFSPWVLTIKAPCPTALFSYPSDYCDNDSSIQSIIFSGDTGGVFSATPAGLALDTLTGDIIPALSTPGTYTVTYTLDSTLNCPIFTTDTTVTIHTTSATPQSASICQGDSIFLGGAFQTASGVYVDSLLNANNCDSIVTTTLTVNPVLTTQVSDSICQGDSILLGGAFQTTAGIYNDTLTSSLGCDSILETTLTINALPTILATVDNDSICPGVVANLDASGGAAYSWDNGLGAGQTHPVTPGATTTYTVIGTDSNGCTGTDSVTIFVNPGTVADAGVSQEFCEDELTTLNLVGNTPAVAGETGIWTTTSSAVIANPTNPTTTASGFTVGSYTFVWTISSATCPPNSDAITIDVISCEPSVIIIPNVFTPNGDGQNDVFTVSGVNLAEVNCNIYNRWGQHLYSWDNVNGAWDGRTTAGAEVPDGTYFFIIEAVGTDGTEYFKKGTVSLIR